MWAGAAWCIGLLVLIVMGPVVYELQVAASRVPRYVPAWEAVPVIVAVVLPSLLAPRMWAYERIGEQRRLRLCALGSGALMLALPALLTVISGVFILPAGARWRDIVFNVLLISAVAVIAVALRGALVGPLVALSAYFLLLIAQQVLPEAGWWLIPLSQGDEHDLPRSCVSAILAGAALAVWTMTLGRSRWVHEAN